MHIGADVLLLLSDAHVELEDDDHDVISPLSFKVGMNNLMVSSLMLKGLTVGLGDGLDVMTHLVGEIDL